MAKDGTGTTGDPSRLPVTRVSTPTLDVTPFATTYLCMRGYVNDFARFGALMRTTTGEFDVYTRKARGHRPWRWVHPHGSAAKTLAKRLARVEANETTVSGVPQSIGRRGKQCKKAGHVDYKKICERRQTLMGCVHIRLGNIPLMMVHHRFEGYSTNYASTSKS